MKRNVEFFRKWIAALRSDKYKQGRGYLYIDSQYCCMGVACDIENPDVWVGNINCVQYWANDAYNLPDQLREKIGLSDDEHDELVNMNDDCVPFTVIADKLEAMIT